MPPPAGTLRPRSERSEGAITLWGMLEMRGAGWGPTGRVERGELRDGAARWVQGAARWVQGSARSRRSIMPGGSTRVQSPGTYQTGAVWRSLQKERQKEWAEERASVGRKEEQEGAGAELCVPEDALQPLDGPCWMSTPQSRFSSVPVPVQTIFPGDRHTPRSWERPNSPGGPPIHPAPPGCLLVDTALAQARGLLLLSLGRGQGQPHRGRTVVDAARTGPGRGGHRD